MGRITPIDLVPNNANLVLVACCGGRQRINIHMDKYVQTELWDVMSDSVSKQLAKTYVLSNKL